MDDPDFWARCPKELEHLVRDSNIGESVGSSYFLLGQPKDDPPTVIALRMGPNWVSARHAHDCYRFEVVVQGTLDVGERVLKPGDVMLTEPGVAYGPHVAGPEGCTTFEIFTNYRSSYVTLIEEPEGLVECDLSTTEGLHRMQDFMERA
jgi:anti-sigma factor ChrR (cupin superfamily)